MISPKFQSGTRQPDEFVIIICLHPKSCKILIGKPTSSIDKISIKFIKRSEFRLCKKLSRILSVDR